MTEDADRELPNRQEHGQPMQHQTKAAPRDHAELRINIEGAGKILKAVGTNIVRPDIDPAAMVDGINLCAQWYREAQHFSTNSGEKRIEECREMIYKRAKALHRLIDTHERLIWSSRHSLGRFQTPLKGLICSLDSYFSINKTESFVPYQKNFKLCSPFEWLVAYFLPDVFWLLNVVPTEQPGKTLSQNSAYVRFVQAVLGELKIRVDGKAYSSASIAKAWHDRWTGQPRRKTTDRDQFLEWRMSLLRKAMRLTMPNSQLEPVSFEEYFGWFLNGHKWQ